MTNFAELLSEAAAADPEHPAVKLDDLVLSYGMLDAAVARAAGLLRAHGVEAGRPGRDAAAERPLLPDHLLRRAADRRGRRADEPAAQGPRGRLPPVGLRREGDVRLARLRRGRARAAPRRPAPSASSSSPASSRSCSARPRRSRRSTERGDDDPAVIIYTSGTTGTPKGATLTHSQPARRRGHRRASWSTPARTGSASSTLPLFHVFGMNSVMNVAVRSRGLLTLVPRFDPEKVLAGDRARQGDLVRRRADDVLGAAAPPRPGEVRRLLARTCA